MRAQSQKITSCEHVNSSQASLTFKRDHKRGSSPRSLCLFGASSLCEMRTLVSASSFLKTRGPFLEGPEKFSGPESHKKNLKP